MLRPVTVIFFSSLLSAVAASPVAGPSVVLDQGTFSGSSSGNTSQFLAIPYAQPPVGKLRFQLPQANNPYTGTYHATAFGPACSQQDTELAIPSGLPDATAEFLAPAAAAEVKPDSEDCLTVNVWAPTTATPASKLPVAVWIFGGGFDVGGAPQWNGSVIVERSIAVGEPIIYVNLNHRLSGWGFLASKEVKAAGVGNLGLQDQREALRWVQKYIGSFGGDPTKVTLWGVSSGAISVASQMIAKGGDNEGLFRGAFMHSGAPMPSGDITNGQRYYNAIVAQTGCSGASDTLDCLRGVSADTLRAAINQTPGVFGYQSVDLAWCPRADGSFILSPSQNEVAKGSVADVPFVTGNNDDEGTYFAMSSTNITTAAEFKGYVKNYFLPQSSDAEINMLLNLYPDNVTQGSPFDTGTANAYTPEFKRVSAFLGDAIFQGPRRYFAQLRGDKQNVWYFLNKRYKSLPILGATHGADMASLLGPADLTDFLINFVTYLDPNGQSNQGHISWPKYTNATPSAMTLLDDTGTPETITQDTYRAAPMAYLSGLLIEHPL